MMKESVSKLNKRTQITQIINQINFDYQKYKKALFV